MRAYFNIYGLALEITSDHHSLFESLLEDLRFFHVKRKPSLKRTVRLTIETLPRSSENGVRPSALFAPFRELASRKFPKAGTTAFCYGTSSIIVLNHIRKRRIQAAVSPDLSLIPDPAYAFCFGQPVSFLLKQRGLFFIHAGCVAQDTQGILIVGPTRTGKSTLTTHAVRAGFQFLGDDQPILSPRNGHVSVLAFPRRVRLDRTVAKTLPELARLLVSSNTERLVFPLEQVWPKSSAPSCKPRVILFPQFRRRGKLTLTTISKPKALARLLQDDYFVWYRNPPWEPISHQHLELFKQLVNQTKAYRLEYGDRDIPKIPSLLRNLLRH